MIFDISVSFFFCTVNENIQNLICIRMADVTYCVFSSRDKMIADDCAQKDENYCNYGLVFKRSLTLECRLLRALYNTTLVSSISKRSSVGVLPKVCVGRVQSYMYSHK